MNQLVGEYDALLRSQLIDQQMYFEKLLAKESVRALEMAYQLKNHQVNSLRHTLNSLHIYKSYIQYIHTFYMHLGKLPAEKSFCHMFHNCILLINTQPQKKGAPVEITISEPDLNINDEGLHRDLLEMEKAKMEISYLESEYQQILNTIRTVDGEVRVLKKSNDEAVASIKAHVRKIYV